MIVSNYPASASPQYVDAISGVLYGQITQGSGVSQGILDATGQMIQNQIAAMSGMSLMDGVLSATTNGPATRLLVDTYNSTNVFGSSYRGRRARGTLTNPSGVFKDDVFLQLVGDGFNGTGFSNAKVSLVFFAAENWATSNNGTYMAFRTTPTGSTAVAERVRITDEGRVGIGLTNPQYALDISGSLNVTQSLLVNGVPVAIDAAQMFSVQVPTGTVALNVQFPVSYALSPQISPTTSSAAGIVYLVNPQTITSSGYTAVFSDTILETGVVLTTIAKP